MVADIADESEELLRMVGTEKAVAGQPRGEQGHKRLDEVLSALKEVEQQMQKRFESWLAHQASCQREHLRQQEELVARLLRQKDGQTWASELTIQDIDADQDTAPNDVPKPCLKPQAGISGQDERRRQEVPDGWADSTGGSKSQQDPKVVHPSAVPSAEEETSGERDPMIPEVHSALPPSMQPPELHQVMCAPEVVASDIAWGTLAATTTTMDVSDTESKEAPKTKAWFNDDEVEGHEDLDRPAELRQVRSFLSVKSSITVADLEVAGQRGQWCLKKVIDSNIFSGGCLLAILANSIFIGVHVEVSLQHEIDRMIGTTKEANPESHYYFSTLEWAFCLFFMFELVLRIAAEPTTFIRGKDWKWSLFDFVLVMTCIADSILKQIQAPNFTYVRILRIVRMARILRIIRVMRFFRSLRLMVYSIVHSLMQLLWVFLLLLFAMYVFSISILHSLHNYFQEKADTQAPVDPSLNVLLEGFSTVEQSLMSLFMSICGGRDWFELYQPLKQASPFCAFIFIFYVFFVVFGVLNTVTGAFVDSMRLVSQQDHDVVIEEELKNSNKYRTEIERLFQTADTDDSGTLSWEEFDAHLKDDRVAAYLNTLELDVSQARALFVLLDVEETDEVPIDKFIEGCMRMRGDAKSIDVNMILYENEKLLLKITSFVEYAEDKFERIERALGLYPADKRRKNSKEWLADRRKSFRQLALSGPSSITPRNAEQHGVTPMGGTVKEESSIIQKRNSGKSIASTDLASRLDSLRAFRNNLGGDRSDGENMNHTNSARSSLVGRSPSGMSCRLDSALSVLAACNSKSAPQWSS